MERVLRMLGRGMSTRDTSVIEILPLLAGYDKLNFVLANDTGLPRSHGRRRVVEVAVWLARTSILPGEIFSSIAISQKDVKNRMAPVLHLFFREKAHGARVVRVVNELVWWVRGWRTLRIEGKDGGGRRFSWTPGERYVRF